MFGARCTEVAMVNPAGVKSVSPRDSLGGAARFGVEIGTPENQPWAMRDFTLFDPSGVLWRVAQNIPARSGSE